MNFAKILVVLVIVGVLAGCSSPAATPATTSTADFTTVIPAATALVDQFVQGDFAAAVQNFDAAMLEALPEAKLKETWEQLLGQVGAYQSQLGTRTGENQGYRMVYVATQFEQAVIDVLVVFDQAGKVSGLFFQPGEAP